MKEVRRRDYNPDAHGNVFDFIVEECERIRYWGGHETKDPIPARDSAWRSLSRHQPGRAVPLLHTQITCPENPRQDVFEISQARKL